MLNLKVLTESTSDIGEFFQNLYQQSSDALLSLPTELKIIIVVVLIGLLIFGFAKKIFKLVWFVLLVAVIYMLLTNLGVM